MSRYVDLPAERRPAGRCIILPGRQYTPDGPLLFFAAQVAASRGWDVRQVWWEPAERGALSVADEMSWVADELAAAVGDHAGPVVVVAKSLGTLAAAYAAERGYDAAWLTPLLTEPEIAEVLRRYPGEQLTVIGAEDPYYDREVFDGLPGERLLVAGDHVLRVPADPLASVDSHRSFTRAFDHWVGLRGN